MNNAELKKCKNNGCNNPVLDGKYCEHCKQARKEKRGDFLKVAGSVAVSVGCFALTVILKKAKVNNLGQKEFLINKAIGWSLNARN